MIFYLDVYRIRLLSLQSDSCSENQYNRTIRRTAIYEKYILDMRLNVKGQTKIVYEYLILLKKNCEFKQRYTFL